MSGSIKFRILFKEFNSETILNCERDCETCLKYMRILKEHVRSTHGHNVSSLPTQYALHSIDSMNIDHDPPQAVHKQSSFIQINCDADENIENKIEDHETQEDSMLNSESDTNLVPENEISDTDPDYTASTHVSRNVRRGGSAKNKTSVSKRSYPKKRKSKPRKQLKCNECNRVFWDSCAFIIHTRVHTGERPFKCDQCGKGFAQRSNLNYHKIIHTGEKPYMCDTCGKSFARSAHLKLHMKYHTGEKVFKCDVCEKSFVMLGSLTDHKRVHTGEKPYVCALCGKCFRNLSTFNGHKRVHTGEKRKKRKVT